MLRKQEYILGSWMILITVFSFSCFPLFLFDLKKMRIFETLCTSWINSGFSRILMRKISISKNASTRWKGDIIFCIIYLSCSNWNVNVYVLTDAKLRLLRLFIYFKVDGFASPQTPLPYLVTWLCTLNPLTQQSIWNQLFNDNSSQRLKCLFTSEFKL